MGAIGIKEAIMFCGSCGKEIEENAKFCPYCGLAVPAAEKVKPAKKEAAGTDMAEQPSPGTTKVSPKNTKIVLSIAIILIGLSGLIIFVLPKGNPKEIFDNEDWLAEEIGETEQTAPSDAETFLERGRMFYDREDYETAIADFSEALSLNPSMAEAYRLRGKSLMVISASDNDRFDEHIDKAIADITQAIRLEPNSAEVYTERGIAYVIYAVRRGIDDKAIADFTQAIRLDSNYYKAYYGRGWCYELKKEYNHAIEDFEAALKIKPDYNEAKQALENVRRVRGY
jgi:Tfp pilus assembly protein PilF